MWSLNEIVKSTDLKLNELFKPGMVFFIEAIIVALLAISLFAILGLVLVLMERKVSSFMQVRLGPNRVGPKGMF